MIISGMVQLFMKGGAAMWPLALCSIASIAIIIDRAVCFRGSATNLSRLLPELQRLFSEGCIEKARELCGAEKGYAARVLSAGLQYDAAAARKTAETAMLAMARQLCNKLRRHTAWLDVIVTLAPLLGLLGTITGMIETFSLLNLKAGQPMAITGGVGEALIATATGLCVAIIALLGQSYFNQRTEYIISQMEEAADAISVFRGERDAV